MRRLDYLAAFALLTFLQQPAASAGLSAREIPAATFEAKRQQYLNSGFVDREKARIVPLEQLEISKAHYFELVANAKVIGLAAVATDPLWAFRTSANDRSWRYGVLIIEEPLHVTGPMGASTLDRGSYALLLVGRDDILAFEFGAPQSIDMQLSRTIAYKDCHHPVTLATASSSSETLEFVVCDRERVYLRPSS